MRVSRVVTLLGEHGLDALAPTVLNRIEDAQLVINHHIALCWIKALHISKLLFLVNINEHAAVERRPKTGAIDFSRLEYRIAIGQNDRWTPLLDMLDRAKGAFIDPIAERIVHEPARHQQNSRIVHLLEPESLQCAEIVGIAEFAPHFLKNFPVTVAVLDAEGS